MGGWPKTPTVDATLVALLAVTRTHTTHTHTLECPVGAGRGLRANPCRVRVQRPSTETAEKTNMKTKKERKREKVSGKGR